MPHDANLPSPFDRRSFSRQDRFTRMGSGSLGAKARGLATVDGLLERDVAPTYEPALQVDIPLLSVIATDVYDRFLNENDLLDVTASASSDAEIADAFCRAPLPADLVADLRAFLAQVRVPLAVRSSSLLEDAMTEPFAGVYATRILANAQADVERRLRALSRAVAFVYASTFFRQAEGYRRATGHSTRDEKMAVIIQEVVGVAHHTRFYPHLSGVARSCNFYPTGLARPEDGVVDLALGLGKTIVAEGVAWSFTPACPHANPPYNTPRDLLERTQKTFWAVDLRGPDDDASGGEIDSLQQCTLSEAEQDGVLPLLASTYAADDDRILAGVASPGPRLVDFAPILKVGIIPLPALAADLLAGCQAALGSPVEIEFAMTCRAPNPLPARVGLLQVRPMLTAYPQVEVQVDELVGPDVLVATDCALGNGAPASIRDIVYVRPAGFGTGHAPAIVEALEQIDETLRAAGRPYVLIGVGRWGSSDPSAGIPVDFGQISGARVIVESTLPGMQVMPSQGSHFFHNITGFKVLYFSLGHAGRYRVDWAWLEDRRAAAETELVRHVQLSAPLEVRVDGRTSRGVIRKSPTELQVAT